MAKQPMPKKLGRYTIVRELGKGAMGIVYEGVDPNINRRVAIKTARRDVMEVTGRADEMMERFLREASTAGQLSHPNIITIYDAAEEGDMAYIAMEFLDGGDLFDLMEQKQRFTPEEAVDIAATICDALAVAHENGIVHRDIKPGNILIPQNAPLKVADFGIARIENSNLTQEGAMIGTPHYMSPEQFMGQRADPRSDLFSVGIILFEMLTGEKPFSGEALSTVMHNVIKSDPIEPQELNFSINDCLSKVVLKALSKKPQERYQTARAMAAALRESLKPKPDPAVTKIECDDADATLLAPSSDPDETLLAPELPDGTRTPVPTGPAAVAAPSAKKKLPLPALVGGGLVLLLVLIIAASSLMGGGDKTPADSGGASGDAEVTTENPNYFKEAVLHLWLADTQQAYDAATAKIRHVQETGGKLNLEGIVSAGTGTVILTKLDEKNEVEKERRVDLSVQGQTERLGKEWTRFLAEAVPDNEAYYKGEQPCEAKKPGDSVNVYIVVIRKDAPLE